MAHPTMIHVGPFDYTVTSKQAEFDAAQRVEQTPLYGNTDLGKLRIVLDPSQAEACMRDTLLHETLHTITAMCAINDDLGADAEEKLVSRLAPALLDVMRRNPDLIAWLTAP